MPLQGDIVKEWIGKWPDIPNLTLARMIYNSDNNHMLFTGVESVRSLIRAYKGSNGEQNRKTYKERKFYQKFKTIQHDPPN